MNQLNCVINYFFQLHLMLHAYIQRFEVMDTVGNFLGTKRGLNLAHLGRTETAFF